MQRDKPYRIQKQTHYTKHDNAISNLQDQRLQKEPCKPPCPQEKKVKK